MSLINYAAGNIAYFRELLFPPESTFPPAQEATLQFSFAIGSAPLNEPPKGTTIISPYPLTIPASSIPPMDFQATQALERAVTDMPVCRDKFAS